MYAILLQNVANLHNYDIIFNISIEWKQSLSEGFFRNSSKKKNIISE